MNLQSILEKYSPQALDQLASDKIDVSLNLRLPPAVIIREIVSALSSFTYVAEQLASTAPPTYAILKLLMDAQNHIHPIEGFQEKVLTETEQMTLRAKTGQGLLPNKNYRLYLNVLKAAWENDGEIDRSEAYVLEVLRREMGLWHREHLLLEHHPEIRPVWETPGAYIKARNKLLATGLVLTIDDSYLLADEVNKQIRSVWGIELETPAYLRMLEKMKNRNLEIGLEKISLPTSGKKEEKIERILAALLPPAEFLDFQHIDELRNFCRETGIQVSGRKSDVITNIVEFFDSNLDLKIQDHPTPIESPLPLEKEPRILDESIFKKLVDNLTVDLLYEMLSKASLRTSGSKEEKIQRILDSPWSENSLLGFLRRHDLAKLCRKLNTGVSGAKQELINRLVEQADRLYGAGQEIILEEEFKAEQSTHASVMNQQPKQEQTPVNSEKSPAKLDEIKEEFPFLSSDEQIIMAVLAETKALSENEIERISQQYHLGWFLIKAQMAEVIAKLKREGRPPISMRGVASTNIYEWPGTASLSRQTVDKNAARDIINALRNGIVPQNHLDKLIIGYDNLRQHLSELLVDISANRKSAFKFIRGPYGAGKTFFMSWLRDHALEKEYAVASVTIGPDQPLSDLPVFYSGLIRGLRTPEKREACALDDIVESWLLSVHRKTAQIEGRSISDQNDDKALRQAVEKTIEIELSSFASFDPSFAPALKAFYHSRCTGDEDLARTSLAWLRGSREIPGSKLAKIGVRGCLEASQVFPRLRALLDIIERSRFNGLVILVDELETIRRFPHSRQREQALENLRCLIDESGKNSLPSCLMIFTGTDSFFEDERAGLKSYEALSNRILTPHFDGAKISMRQPVITLEGMNAASLLKVAGKIRDLHGIAYGWDPSERITDLGIETIVQEWTSLGDEDVKRQPRKILKQFVYILDICEENPNVRLSEFIQLPATGIGTFNQADIQNLSEGN